ncbi:unnamed protein product [Nippostrongylus brasiliensis]|uniref:Secreted protein n=1 Tax=Nippostrongylus brasiliensis TaxID=27835 RepID=A0A0N4Y117_NIPBR|nr:unnamed protein product [Nippostrongylus brasiliensis]
MMMDMRRIVAKMQIVVTWNMDLVFGCFVSYRMSHIDDGVLQSSGKLIFKAVGGKYKSGWESMQYVTPCDRMTSMDKEERTYCSGFFPDL